MGYVILGIGIGALILARGGNAAWASMAILGGLFHLVNHAVFKSLLFLTSGSVEMATGTRHLKQLGGLAEKLPFTRTACTIASASIAGIPPFNGFWSKLILVIAAAQARLWALAVVTVIVSLVTLISFLKVQRYVFLGELPENLQQTKESLCMLMGLLLIPSLRGNILTPAVKVLTDGLQYSANIIGN
jgi:multicomponent Na+:H+ antiporter subunit D